MSKMKGGAGVDLFSLPQTYLRAFSLYCVTYAPGKLKCCFSVGVTNLNSEAQTGWVRSKTTSALFNHMPMIATTEMATHVMCGEQHRQCTKSC